MIALPQETAPTNPLVVLITNGMQFCPEPVRVAAKLYMGAFMREETRTAARSGLYDLIVHCAAELAPTTDLPRGAELALCPFDDRDGNLDPLTLERVLVTARRIHRARTLGKRVLVGCAMGLNRSGLVTGLALRLGGMDPKEAVLRIRKARGPDALSNRTFERLVLAKV